MFAGQTGGRDLSDTWVYGPSGWNELFPNNVPPTRFDHATAYDEARDRIVMFGGVFFQNQALLPRGDTWEFDGQDWIQVVSQTSPPARFRHAMAYDSARGRAVLYGGTTGLGAGRMDQADTWEWDGTQWTQIFTSGSAPPPAAGHAMAYDAARGVIVLVYGPLSGTGLQTWEYDGVSWIRRFPLNVPPDRRKHTLSYDSARQRIVLFGGNPSRAGNYTGVFNDVWEYDGSDWRPRSPATSPPAREGHGMAYDTAREQVIVFGGRSMTSFRLADTWAYSPVFPAQFWTFGAGCAGSAGTPALTVASGSRPWLGETFSLELVNLRARSAAILCLGTSNTQWGPRTLPFGLASMGMPGCTAYVGVEVALLLPVSSSGTSQQPVAVPANVGLLGTSVFGQAIALDPGVNSLGATVTNAGGMLVGAR